MNFQKFAAKWDRDSWVCGPEPITLQINQKIRQGYMTTELSQNSWNSAKRAK